MRQRKWPHMGAPAGAALMLGIAIAGLSSCDETGPARPESDVVIYCSVDQEFAEAILSEFQKERPDIQVEARFDTEATKTTGLVERLRAEQSNPQADLFWSSEVFLTIQLAEEGLLQPFPPSQTVSGWPEMYRGDQGEWYGFAGRARVIAYDPARVTDPPVSWLDLADPKYRGRVVMADPNFGTTRGHIAAWAAWWGQERARSFLEELKANDIRIVRSNSQTVRDVVSGLADFAITDTDDVWAANRNGAALRLVYPRHGAEEGMGTLLIPNTLALVADRPIAPPVTALAEFILSPELERLMYESDSHNLPIRYRADIEVDPKYELPDPLIIDYNVVTEHMDDAIAAANEVLIDGDGAATAADQEHGG